MKSSIIRYWNNWIRKTGTSKKRQQLTKSLELKWTILTCKFTTVNYHNVKWRTTSWRPSPLNVKKSPLTSQIACLPPKPPRPLETNHLNLSRCPCSRELFKHLRHLRTAKSNTTLSEMPSETFSKTSMRGGRDTPVSIMDWSLEYASKMNWCQRTKTVRG